MTAIAARMNGKELAYGLRDYSVAADWPAQFAASFPDAANYGVILRWRAALDAFADKEVLAHRRRSRISRTW